MSKMTDALPRVQAISINWQMDVLKLMKIYNRDIFYSKCSILLTAFADILVRWNEARFWIWIKNADFVANAEINAGRWIRKIFISLFFWPKYYHVPMNWSQTQNTNAIFQCNEIVIKTALNLLFCQLLFSLKMKTELLEAYAAINPHSVVYADWNMDASFSSLWVRSMFHHTIFIQFECTIFPLGDTAREFKNQN